MLEGLILRSSVAQRLLLVSSDPISQALRLTHMLPSANLTLLSLHSVHTAVPLPPGLALSEEQAVHLRYLGALGVVA